METKPLNEWLVSYGYVWVDGKERIYKALLTTTSAQVQICQLAAEGVIKHA